MNKLLVICGPTASGKTDTALKIADEFNGEIISADSRQVYKGLDIGTGKDIPKNSKFKIQNSKLGKRGIGYWLTSESIRIWGIDLVGPKEEFSVSRYMLVVQTIIDDIEKRGKLPILVGGTGLYIKAIVDGIPTASVPKNIKLRRLLKGKRTGELFQILKDLDEKRATSMNMSDRNNPRRLVRAIEVAKLGSIDENNEEQKDIDVLLLGLKIPWNELKKRIKRRVQNRVDEGLENEVRTLLSSGVDWGDQSMQALGYKNWKYYFNGKIDKKDVIDGWIKDEIKYAKRQITWFKKDKRIIWVDPLKRNYYGDLEKIVIKWYSKKD